jgi:hypothetical protein
MFAELLYKLRGIDKWPEARATVSTTEIVSEGGRSGLTKNIYFSYKPTAAEIQTGEFFVDSYTSVYWLNESDTFDIQYNPDKPSCYYCKEATSLSSDVRLIAVTIGILFFIFVLIVQILDKAKR